jgi:hypothetical protein
MVIAWWFIGIEYDSVSQVGAELMDSDIAH